MIFVSSEDVADPKVIISDFGEAFYNTEEEHTTLRTPITLLPPEFFFHERLGPAVDVWTLGCTLYEILGERPLFEGFMPDQDDIIAEMISTLGDLPKRWWEQWKHRDDFFLEDGSWKQDTQRIHSPYSRPLSERMRIMGRGENPKSCEFSSEEMASLEQLLRAMLIYEPSERITSSAAVASDWMERWARPEIQKKYDISS
ncbi:hypothetical protein H2201_007827 [Coniosporium apollinis]|uniref:Protein kinase domain-containing protein n=1 Tax=Coniosporium apollinis TaxID=61459 RepID=A0ABQ9NIA6_9PEZI|nr:hypothetical protein H2201_007827 [Coniosporium apollinis]